MRYKETKHSVGENLIIVRLAALDGGMGRRRRCCEREAFSDKDGEGTRCQETKHSLGENLRILRVAALDGCMAALDGRKGRRRQCCGRKALRDNEGEGTRCKETKHSLDENVIIVRLVSLDGGRDRRSRCCGREALLTMRGRG